MTTTRCLSEERDAVTTPRHNVDDIRRLSAAVNLVVENHRLSELCEAANHADSFICKVSHIPCGETAPATSFDPRWK